MKKLRKFAALVMALMMFATLLAACGDNNLRLSLAVEGGVTSVAPGGSAKFTATVVEGETDSIVYSITAGSEHATIDSSTGDLDVLPTAQYGATISVVATSGEVTSNTVSITVASPSLTSVTISANASDKVVAGQQISFSAVVAPSTISGATVVYTVNGAAAINGNVMTVNADAAEDSVISVKATATYDGKSVESNTLTFTVIPLTDTDYSISIVNENLTVDKYGTAQVIEAEIYDGNHKVDGVDVLYQITSGSEYIDVNYETGSVTAKGHGTATVTVSIAGTTVSETCTINSIVPPDSIFMPSDLPQDEKVKFAFGLRDYNGGSLTDSSLGFEPVIGGTNVCRDYTVEFFENGVKDENIAEYNSETKAITFKKTGTFTIRVTSASGSARETVYEREIFVNNGINVRTMADFIAVMNNAEHQNDEQYQSVNLFADLIGFDGSAAQQTVEAIRNQTIASFGDRYLYGNDFSIDLSNVRIITRNERVSSGGLNVPDFMNFKGYGNWGGDGLFHSDAKLFTVEIYDLSLTGNIGASTEFSKLDLPEQIPSGGILDDTPANRAYRRGINIASEHGYYDDDNSSSTAEVFDEANAQVCKDLVMQNVTVSGFYIGTTLQGVANGNITDCTFTDAYASSVDTLCSQITFRDVVFGQCGVAGIELTSKYYDEAGENFDQKQTITFEGTIVCENWANGKSNHMAYDDTLNVFMDIVKANMPSDADARSNLLTDEAKGINWLIYVDAGDADAISDIRFNTASVADAPESGKDTEHIFLKKTVEYSGSPLGVIYVGNLNYQA